MMGMNLWNISVNTGEKNASEFYVNIFVFSAAN